MNILGIDTTTNIAGVCLYKNDSYLTNYIDTPLTHSEKLLPLIDSTLHSSDTNLSDIDLFAVITGPRFFYRH